MGVPFIEVCQKNELVFELCTLLWPDVIGTKSIPQLSACIADKIFAFLHSTNQLPTVDKLYGLDGKIKEVVFFRKFIRYILQKQNRDPFTQLMDTNLLVRAKLLDYAEESKHKILEQIKVARREQIVFLE